MKERGNYLESQQNMFKEWHSCLNGSKSIVCVCVCSFWLCVYVYEPDSSVQLTGVPFVLLKQLVSSASTLAG